MVIVSELQTCTRCRANSWRQTWVQFHQIQVLGYDTKSWKKIRPMGCQIAVASYLISHPFSPIFNDFASYPEIWIWWNWISWLINTQDMPQKTCGALCNIVNKIFCCFWWPALLSDIDYVSFVLVKKCIHFRLHSSLLLLHIRVLAAVGRSSTGACGPGWGPSWHLWHLPGDTWDMLAGEKCS